MVSLVVAAAFADPVCVDLCGECTSLPGDATCKKVDALCKCKATLDSANAMVAVIEQSKGKLVADISAGCPKTACSRNFTFENGQYVKFEKGRTSLTTAAIVNGATVAGQKSKTQKPVALKKAEATLDSLTRRRMNLTLPPMTMECNTKCNSCDAADTARNLATQNPATQNAQTRIDSVARADSLANVECQKTEKICMCAVYRNNAAQLAVIDSLINISKARVDSLAKIGPTLIRGDMAMQIADTTHALCAGASRCTFEVTFTSAELALLELHKVEEPAAPESPAALTASITPATLGASAALESPAASEAPAESAQNATTSAQANAQPTDSASRAALVESCTMFYSENKAEFDSLKKTVDSKRIFYKGSEIAFGKFSESEIPLEGDLDETSFEGRLGYVFRWYFYDAGAVNLGLGFVYHYHRMISDEDDVHQEYKYHYGALDIPITLRLGVPKIPYVRPYVSESFVFQKPLVLAYHEKYEGDGKNHNAWENDMYDFGDWEFTVWLGFGVEFTRHFSVEYQMMLGSKAMGDAIKYDDGETFRVALQFML